MSDTDNLARAIALFNESLNQPSGGRDAWLKAQCAKDTPLLLQVQRMLLADAETQAVFATGGALPPDLAAQFAPPPSQIGQFTIVELLGEGGMGRVYLADRNDGVVQQQVAIKLLKNNLASTRLIQQFSHERQIMANLRHPAIASLLDGGTTQDDLPYLVMEYIQGLSLADYLKQNNPNLQQRLKLFQKLLGGVAHAHQNLIIHRDIKPGNVMVTSAGEPKLMDFGVARLLDPSEPKGSQTGQAADTVAMLMTPSYASPEQIRGEPLSTATDVYSLGLLLFESLSGEPLLDVEGLSPLNAEKRIHDSADTLPSDRAKRINPALTAQLRGDLDAIIRKATAVDAADRYPTVAALSADLDAYSSGQAVSAQRHTWRYRSGKFVRRHWLAVTGAGLVAISVIAAGLYSAQQAAIAQDQRAIAEQESAAARDAMTFLKNMLFSVNPLTGEANAKTIDDVLAAMDQELADSFDERPATRTLLLASAAEVYLGRANLDKAAELAEQAHNLAGSTPGIPLNSSAFAKRVLAQVRLDQGDFEQAAAGFRASTALYEQSPGQHWGEISSNYNDLGATLIYLSEESEAESSYRKSLEIHEGPNLDDPESYATNLSNLAGLYMDQGNYEAAEKLQQKAIKIFETNAASAGRIGMSLSNHAGTLWRLGRMQEAEQEYLAAINKLETALGEEHPDVLLATTSLGALYLELKDYDKGAPIMLAAAEIAERTLDPNHQAHSYAKNIAGQLLCETSDTSSGSKFLRDSLEARIAAYGTDHWAVASSRSSLGNCLGQTEALAEAEQLLKLAVKDLEALRGADHHMTLLAAERLARVQQRMTNHETLPP